MFGLTILDIIVLISYFGVIIYIGVRASFKIKNSEDYFLGGRKFGKLTSTFAKLLQLMDQQVWPPLLLTMEQRAFGVRCSCSL